MARRKTKSRKQQRIEAKDEVASRKFTLITIGITLILLIIMYFSYNGF
jgi:hypothetical protein